jgi:hypothetical protein
LRGEAVKGQLEAQGREAQIASELPVQQAQLKGEYAQKEAQALKFLQSTMNKLTPLAQFLNTMGVKIPSK